MIENDALKDLTAKARERAAQVGPMHAIWDVIADAEAYLAGRDANAILSRSEIERMLTEFLTG